MFHKGILNILLIFLMNNILLGNLYKLFVYNYYCKFLVGILNILPFLFYLKKFQEGMEYKKKKMNHNNIQARILNIFFH